MASSAASLPRWWALALLLVAVLAPNTHFAAWAAEAGSVDKAQDRSLLFSGYPTRSAILGGSTLTEPNAASSNHVRKLTDGRTVLGFTTPWRPEGLRLLETYRGKFDIASPAWHDIEVKTAAGDVYYEIQGHPRDDEVAWMHRLQSSVEPDEAAGRSQRLPSVKIVPRFTLGSWSPEDMVEMLGSDKLMKSLVETVVAKVREGGYDGVVFESSAVFAIAPLVEQLSKALHAEDKLLISVLPPLRDEKDGSGKPEDIATLNRITLAGMRSLSPWADHVVVMTYDFAGPRGLALDKDEELHEKSPLRKQGVRTPAPNTPLSFLETTLERLSAPLETMGGGEGGAGGAAGAATDPFAADYLQNLAARGGGEGGDGGDGVGLGAASGKLLAGVALYGYTYSIGWFRRDSDSDQGVPRMPPSSPLASKDNDTALQEKHRKRADERDAESNTVPVQRLPGQVFEQSDLLEQLEAHKALLRSDGESAEMLLDYVAELPPELQPDFASETGKNYSSYYRAFVPSAHTVQRRLEVASSFPGVGVALWELGSAAVAGRNASWLLDVL